MIETGPSLNSSAPPVNSFLIIFCDISFNFFEVIEFNSMQFKNNSNDISKPSGLYRRDENSQDNYD